MKAADTILQKGVRVPIVSAPLLFRIFGRKRIGVVLRQPSVNGILMISRLVVEMGLSPGDFQNMTLTQCYEIINKHGMRAMQIIAISILRWPPAIWFYKVFARWLSNRMEPLYAGHALYLVLNINGAGDFMNSIRLFAEKMPNLLSPRIQGSQGVE